MKLIIAGPRDYFNYDEVSHALDVWMFNYNCMPEEIVSGAQTGVDTIAKELAKYWGIPYKPFPANWTAYDRAAGPIRNKQMAIYVGVYGGLLAIRRRGQKLTRGTGGMVKIAHDFAIPHIDIYDVEA